MFLWILSKNSEVEEIVVIIFRKGIKCIQFICPEIKQILWPCNYLYKKTLQGSGFHGYYCYMYAVILVLGRNWPFSARKCFSHETKIRFYILFFQVKNRSFFEHSTNKGLVQYVSDCCFMPIQQFFSYVLARTV